jgi:hypothetical protein
MNLFQRGLSEWLGGEQRSHGAQSQQIGTPTHGAGKYLNEMGLDRSTDDAAERTANIASVTLAGHPLSEAEKDLGGTIFHYLFGATTGMAYGIARELVPASKIGWGIPFGAAVWLIADETVVPALGLSKHARKYSASINAYALAAHLVYGLATEVVLKTLSPGQTNHKEIPTADR